MIWSADSLKSAHTKTSMENHTHTQQWQTQASCDWTHTLPTYTQAVPPGAWILGTHVDVCTHANSPVIEADYTKLLLRVITVFDNITPQWMGHLTIISLWLSNLDRTSNSTVGGSKTWEPHNSVQFIARGSFRVVQCTRGQFYWCISRWHQ